MKLNVFTVFSIVMNVQSEIISLSERYRFTKVLPVMKTNSDLFTKIVNLFAD